MRKMKAQAILLLFMFALFFGASKINNFFVVDLLDVFKAELNKEYDTEDVKAFASDAIDGLKRAPETVTTLAQTLTAPISYADPIDAEGISDTLTVHAVSGGTVSEVGEDGVRGKYIKIIHSDKAISVYGNCDNIFVQQYDRVKRGQIIADFNSSAGEEFYHTLSSTSNGNIENN